MVYYILLKINSLKLISRYNLNFSEMFPASLYKNKMDQDYKNGETGKMAGNCGKEQGIEHIV